MNLDPDTNEWSHTVADTEKDEDSRDAGFHHEDILREGCKKGTKEDKASAAAGSQASKHSGHLPWPRRQA